MGVRYGGMGSGEGVGVGWRKERGEKKDGGRWGTGGGDRNSQPGQSALIWILCFA